MNPTRPYRPIRIPGVHRDPISHRDLDAFIRETDERFAALWDEVQRLRAVVEPPSLPDGEPNEDE